MLVLGVDFETTGLDPEKHRVVEVGAVLWDTDVKMPLRIFSQFCWAEDYPEMEAAALDAHGLTPMFLQRWGVNPAAVFLALNDHVSESDACVAHNGAQFDAGFYEAECKRAGIVPPKRVWIDTAMDLKYPEKMLTRNLVHLAAEHGFLNPFAHRAVFDVLTMLKVFQNYDPQVALEYAGQPFVKCIAVVSFADKDLAKARGYRWDPEKRDWWKVVRASDAEIEKQETAFTVKVLEMDKATR